MITFRQHCAVTAMREMVRAATSKKVNATKEEFCRDLAEASFAIADAMVKASGPEPSQYGAAPSRSGRTGGAM